MKIVLLVFATVFVISCKTHSVYSEDYLRWVGDSVFNPELDNPSFNLCDPDEVGQYHNFSSGLQYVGEKAAIVDQFDKQYKSVNLEDENGLIRIRFIVNCNGETDRFRVLGMNEKYEERQFDPRITEQLVSITRSLSGWKTLPAGPSPKDYYQYLIFKIKAGKIIEIMP